MATAAQHGAEHLPEYIEISSDSESGVNDGEAVLMDANEAFEAAFIFDDDFAPPPEGNELDDAFWDLLEDPTAEVTLDPDVSDTSPFQDPATAVDQISTSAGPSTSECVNMLTPEICITKIVEILPDICEDHIRQLYERSPPRSTDWDVWLDRVISSILEEGVYPKRRGVKRKREDEEASQQPWKEFEKPGRAEPDKQYTTAS